MPRLLTNLPELTLNGIIDILVVAFLVYQALMVVRGTRAFHILLGILTMVVLYAAAVMLRAAIKGRRERTAEPATAEILA